MYATVGSRLPVPQHKRVRSSQEVSSTWVLSVDSVTQIIELLADGCICVDYKRVGGGWTHAPPQLRLPERYTLKFYWNGDEEHATTCVFKKIRHADAFLYSIYNTSLCRTERQYMLPWHPEE